MHIAIVDDIPQDRASLSQLVVDILGRYDIVPVIREFSSGEAFLAALQPDLYDLCFLDIHMSGINGMETARQLRTVDSDCLLIFLTCSAQHVYQGYEVGAFRYLIKNEDEEKLPDLLAQCLERVTLNRRRLPVQIGKRKLDIAYSKIRFIATAGPSIELYTMNGTFTLAAHTTFSDTVAPLLEDHRFLSCSRGVVVNMARAKEILDDCFLMEDGRRVPISRRQYSDVSSRFFHFLFSHIV